MILVHCSYLIAIAALSHLADYAKGFPSFLQTRGSSNHGRTLFVSGCAPLALIKDDNGHLDDEEGTANWTMEEDWALVDNLPLFTVSTTTETKTFWTQLWSANSAFFSGKEPEDLYQRTLELQQERQATVAIMEKSENRRGRRSLLVFGDSPPVLENWKIDVEQQDNRAVGQIGNGNSEGRRTIWFHYHSIGRLEGDPFADGSSRVVSLFPGGYIEAVGGRIYELGQPMMFDKWHTKDGNKLRPNTQEISRDSVREDGEKPSIPRWLLPGGTAAMSALVSATILSACIGYGAGLSMIRDQPSPYSAWPVPNMLTVETVLAGPSNSNGVKMLPPSSSSTEAAVTKSSAIKTSNLNQAPSTEELRARAQYRVLREERLLEKISQRLEIDKQTLKQLDDQQSSGLHP